MFYASFGLLAIIVVLTLNRKILFKKNKNNDPASEKSYRLFLYGVLLYFVIDVLWGIFDEANLNTLLYIDTVFYFLVSGIDVFLWTRYVVKYLEGDTIQGKVLVWSGLIYAGLELVIVIVNIFYPILFSFNDDGDYKAGIVRHVMIIIQILIYLSTAIFSLFSASNKDNKYKMRYEAIGVFAVSMAMILAIQMAFPLWPLCTIAHTIGITIIYSFVIEDEKEEYRISLESALHREKEQRKELGSTRRLAYTDSLTGVKNKLAYVEKEEQMEARVASGELKEFAIAVFDLNNLKQVNDEMGHENGDQYIISACRIICNYFKHSPVYRIGGDEFVAIMEGEDYQNRDNIKEAFYNLMKENLGKKEVVVAIGVACFNKDHDNTYQQVFKKADQEMYAQKQKLKTEVF